MVRARPCGFVAVVALACASFPAGPAWAQANATAGVDLGATLGTAPQGPGTLDFAALTLTAPSLVPGQRMVPGCDAEAETTGNSEALGTGLPLIGSLALHLSPRLSVLSFSRLGCPLTSGLGMVMQYEIPLSRTLSLALGAGAYAMPQALEKGVATKALLRADLVFKRPGGRVSHTWGVQALGTAGTSSSSTVTAAYGLHF